MHYMVKKTDLYEATFFQFESTHNGMMDILEMGQNKVIYYDGLFLDFKGNIVEKVNFYALQNGHFCLDMEVRENTTYMDCLTPCKQVTNEELKKAMEVVQYYELKKTLIEEKKMVVFPNKVIV